MKPHRSKWIQDRPWVRSDGVQLRVKQDQLEEIEEDDGDEEATVHLTPTDREFEVFAWLNRVYRGARSNTWWSHLFIVSTVGVLTMILLGLGRMRGDGLLAVLFVASTISMVISLLAVYFSYELFLSREPEGLTDFSRNHWQSLTRTALYFPIYLIIFSLFCNAVGLDQVSTGMSLAYRLNGIVLSVGLYQRMTTLADYLKSESLRKRVGFLNAPFWTLIVLLAIRLMVENGIIPLLADRTLRIAYLLSTATAALVMYVNYYFVMRQFGIVIRQHLLDEANRYSALRQTYELALDELEEDEQAFEADENRGIRQPSPLKS